MIRFIFARRVKNSHNGAETDFFETFDMDIPELENIIARGGQSETGYDITELVGIEVRETPISNIRKRACNG